MIRQTTSTADTMVLHGKISTKMIQLEEKNIEEIKAYLAELPLKYALPLVQYLENIIKEQHSDDELH